MPNVEIIHEQFLAENDKLLEFNAPKLKMIGYYSLYLNTTLVKFNVPNLERSGAYFLYNNKHIELPEDKVQTLKKTL